jgi:glyoxylase-like metal-dependent hydrolase (beta-lactamase superfamily II)
MTQFSVGSFVPVADQIFVAVAQPADVNIGLILGPTGGLIIDTGSSPEQGAAIKAAAEALSGVKVVAVLATHWHYDHLFGLAGFEGIPSIAHESVAAWLERPEALGAAGDLGLDPATLCAPTSTFSLAKVIDAGGRRVEVLHFGPGHTDGDVVVYVPDAQVIFAGDLLESAGPPSFGPDCDLKSWPTALDGLLGLTKDGTVIVPGHGPAIDRMAAFEQRSRISALYGQFEYVIGLGKSVEDAYEAAEWPFDEQTVRAALPVGYAQLAAAGVTPKRQLPLLGGH